MVDEMTIVFVQVSLKSDENHKYDHGIHLSPTVTDFVLAGPYRVK